MFLPLLFEEEYKAELWDIIESIVESKEALRDSCRRSIFLASKKEGNGLELVITSTRLWYDGGNCLRICITNSISVIGESTS